ncbi:MAG: hypothetical protein ABI907_00680 [Ramlibacter sp.]
MKHLRAFAAFAAALCAGAVAQPNSSLENSSSSQNSASSYRRSVDVSLDSGGVVRPAEHKDGSAAAAKPRAAASGTFIIVGPRDPVRY